MVTLYVPVGFEDVVAAGRSTVPAHAANATEISITNPPKTKPRGALRVVLLSRRTAHPSTSVKSIESIGIRTAVIIRKGIVGLGYRTATFLSEVIKIIFTVIAELPGMTALGVMVQLATAGTPEHESTIMSVKDGNGVIVSCKLVEFPARTMPEGDVRLSEKSCPVPRKSTD